METSCLESHENKRELGGYCCSRGPAVDSDSDWRLSPAHSRSFEAPENQSWLVWGSFREPAVLQKQTPERIKGNWHIPLIGNLA